VVLLSTVGSEELAVLLEFAIPVSLVVFAGLELFGLLVSVVSFDVFGGLEVVV
jgi:hypothetical protein